MREIVLRDYQMESVERLRDGIRAGHRAQVLMAPTGAGKCLGRDTPVMMSDGTLRNVQDVAAGDRLMGDDGTPRNVLSVTSGWEMLYRVTPRKGDSYVVNASHLLSLRLTPGSDGIRLADGSHIARGSDVVAVRADVFAGSNTTAKHCLKGWRAPAIKSFNREHDDDAFLMPPYLLGAWLGDGRVGHAAITKPSCRMVDEWIAYGATFGYTASMDACDDRCPTWLLTEGRNGRSFNLIQSQLECLDVLHRKHIPDAYKYAPINVRLELLAGLIDSDGSESHGGCDWISVSEELARDFAFVCRSVGLACYLSPQKKGIRETGFEGWYWRASVSGDLSIIPTRDKPFASRKQIKRHLVHGISVEPIGEGKYYGFQIDGNHLFLLGDFTVTHNTEIASYMLEEVKRKYRRALFIVDRVNLVDQTSDRLDSYGISHGIIQAGHWRTRLHERIQVCSAQTIERRGIPEDVDVVFVDEAHCMRRKVTEFIEHTAAVVIGLTATPFTKGMGKVYSNLVNVTTMNELIARQFLVPLKMYAAKTIRTEGMKVVAGEWAEKEIETRGLEIVGDIVAEWQDKTALHFGGPVKTIVFSATVAHGEELCKRFRDAGFNFQQISYRDTDDNARRAVIEEFRKSDSEIHGLVSCEVFTKGFDVPDVLCLAEGSKVLTQRGLIAIEKVLLSDRIWDGFEFVEHGGPIFKGEQDVIEYAGLTATAEHKVKTAQGWRTFGQCAREQIPIVATGFGGAPVRESEGYFTRGDVAWREMEAEAAHPSRLRDVRQGIKRFARLATWLPSAGLFGLQKIGTTFAVVSGAREVAESTMRGSIAQGISELWRAWCGVPVPVSAGWCGMGSRQSRNTEAGSKHPTGSEKQRRPLRAGQPSVGIENAQRLQHATRRMDGEGAQIQAGSPGNQVCGQDSAQSNFSGVDGQANHGAVQPSIGQAKRRVWDILNAGPRNCFTCEGLLVHNCGISARPYRKSLSSHIQQIGRVMRASPGKEFGLWLDHAGNLLRFREDVEEIFQHGMSELDDGKLEAKVRKEPTEKERQEIKCSCGYLMLPSDDACPGCGKIRHRHSMVEQLPGEMVELAGKPANKSTTWADKQALMAGLKTYAKEHGYQPGWAAHKYQEKFGVWPNDPRVKSVLPGPVSAELERWVRSQAIRWAKRRKAA